MTQLTRRNVLLLAVIMAAATTVVAYLFLTRQQVQALDKENKGATHLVFPKSLKQFVDKRVIGIDWTLVRE